MSFATESLIEAVCKRPILWDVSNIHFKDRRLSAPEWENVCKELKVTDCSLVKRKWKALKDYYRSELNRVNKRMSESSDGSLKTLSSWPYFKQLTFIKKTLGKSKQSWTPCEDDGDTQADDSVFITCDNISDITEVLMGNPSEEKDDDEHKAIQYKTPNSRKCPLSDNESDRSVENDKKKLCIIQNYEEDDDMLFFQSLLPDVRSLSRPDKLLLRMDIQRLVYNAIIKVKDQ